MEHKAETREGLPYLDGYAPQSGVSDELFDATGRMRPVWQPFVDAFTGLSRAEIAGRFERGNQYLRDAGVYFRQYSNEPLQEREWPLSHVPVVLHETEWETICAGLAQRADLLEAVMADLYGPGRLVAEGHLPVDLVAESDHWLLPMVGVPPAGGHYLHVLAFEIGRSPDGSWFVLGDRTQAPSGAGFALENRMATSRMFPESFSNDRIHRLAGFFNDFRGALDRLATGPDGQPRRTGILTPGPANDAYFEHTYIARYLGLMLLEGEDLTVQNGQAMVRTIEGPEPVGALWRRIDGQFADPLEFDPDSRIGTPGLMESVATGNLALANALGSGVLEARAMMAFLPRISRVLTGKPLSIPNIATWWCGAAKERDYVRANAGRMVIGPAGAVDLPFDWSSASVVAGTLRDTARGSLDELLATEGATLVGQEAVNLSTTPAWVGDGDTGALRPSPMTVRVFATRTPEGWRFMKGGYARIGPEGDAAALAMQRGGTVADVWIAADAPVPQPTLDAAPATFRRQRSGTLPSRAADNLFWLGRYMERCEDLIRLVRAYHLRLATMEGPDDPRLKLILNYTAPFGADATQAMPDALLARLSAAQDCASKIRDRFSMDGWHALRDLSQTMREMQGTTRPGDDAARAMSVLLRKITGFNGLVHENMYRFAGWRFLSLGRAIERADGLVAMLATFTDEAAPAGALDVAVEVADSVMTHQRRYRVNTNRETVVDLLALDADNPRAVLFQIAELERLAAGLPKATEVGRPGPLLRQILPLKARLEVADPADITPEVFAGLRAEFAAISGQIALTYLR
ncbi:circularly permuted type 2 ATP-grasp protein [Maritimibacter sp. UBA3975]|uniref:circularly permuted type 2 ATP-grasp protein n=1 Tax=Maritimibacter sp. UBA3975 TaxID=1946833 RepID=UPI000C08EC5A|nr:circularly permuted type 2 ATP-grasp protein [Maritimibacter sp. UBA3975]MAM60246.1 hypothetical protein [Maritimibacter sp.]|tara:strand:+ start:4173 stop:6587 length:2415 start_codon:yes stop_codon:yes gene_type:complete